MIFLVLVWLLVIPVNLIQSNIEDIVAHSGNSNMRLDIEGLNKGLFFSLFADRLHLSIDNTPAVDIIEFKGSFAPGYLLKGTLGASVTGEIADGDMNGTFQLPAEGDIKIEKAELKKIAYLNRFGLDISGQAYADINIHNQKIDIQFKVPDLHIDEASTIIPLISTFRTIQGAVTIIDNQVRIDSISLEGDKGYARLKGNIVNNRMDLAIELMPDRDKLNALESMMLGKYIVSPGFYVVPLKGLLP